MDTKQDSPKVPKGGWPSVLHVVEVGPGSTPPSFRASAKDTWLPELAKQPYIPVSALLSDEVVEAVRTALLADDGDSPRDTARRALQAVIEQAGGAK